MNVETIEMTREEAKQKLKAYRTALRRRADDEYEAAAQGYEALAEGRALINVADAIRQAPRDEMHRPMLAMARADRNEVEFTWRGTRCAFDCSAEMNARYQTLLYTCDMEDVWPGPGSPWNSRGYALVPMVPADVRLEAGNPKMSECWILWEVEEWAERRIGATPDRDPFLLRHLVGELYCVLGAWDLTELERSIMAGRARS